MATRKIIDIEQNGEKVWPKGHAKATYMSDGSTVEDAINQIGTGGGGTQGPQGPEGPKGEDGVGVQSVTQTTTSNADGGSNVVTVTLTDGAKSTFTVKNGSKGSQGIQGEQGPKGDTGATGAQGPKGDKGDKGDTGAAGADGTNGKDGTDGEDGATFTPSVDSAGNLSWTNNKGLTNPPTVNIKGPKGDAGEGGSSSGGSPAYPQVNHGINDTSMSLTPNTFHVWDEVRILSLTFGAEQSGVANEYIFEFVSPAGAGTVLSLPTEIMWANDNAIKIEASFRYQVSIMEGIACWARVPVPLQGTDPS